MLKKRSWILFQNTFGLGSLDSTKNLWLGCIVDLRLTFGSQEKSEVGWRRENCVLRDTNLIIFNFRRLVFP